MTSPKFMPLILKQVLRHGVTSVLTIAGVSSIAAASNIIFRCVLIRSIFSGYCIARPYVEFPARSRQP